MRNLVIGSVLGGALAVVASAASATPMMEVKYKLNAGATTIMADNAVGDGDSDLGAIIFSVSDILVKVAMTGSFSENPTEVHFDIFVPKDKTTPAGFSFDVFLTVYDLDTGLVGPVTAGGHSSVQTTAVSSNSAVTFESSLDDANTPYGTGFPLLSTVAADLDAVNDGKSANFFTTLDGTYSVTHHYHITATGKDVGDINLISSTLVAVPEPATLALFGVGLLGLGIVRRRKAA